MTTKEECTLCGKEIPEGYGACPQCIEEIIQAKDNIHTVKKEAKQ